ncbi:hypothetical protein K8I61_11285, partial [bacterium]|nr:hypothetical protein [bacterium]
MARVKRALSGGRTGQVGPTFFADSRTAFFAYVVCIAFFVAFIVLTAGCGGGEDGTLGGGGSASAPDPE